MDKSICIPFFFTRLSLVTHSNPGLDFSSWLSGAYWWMQLWLCGADAAGTTPLPLLLPSGSCQDCVFVLAGSACSFCAGPACLWEHPVGTWISGFCQLWLVLSFPCTRMTPDVCSTRGYGKLMDWEAFSMLQIPRCHLAWGLQVPGGLCFSADSRQSLCLGEACW